MPAGNELILQVSKPAAGESSELRVSSTAGARVLLSLDFEPSEALSELVDDDLVFTFDDDAELVLRDCFAGEHERYPDFVLADGSELDGGELYAVLSGSVKLFPEDDGPPALGLDDGHGGVRLEGAPDTRAPEPILAATAPPDDDLNALLHTILQHGGVS